MSTDEQRGMGFPSSWRIDASPPFIADPRRGGPGPRAVPAPVIGPPAAQPAHLSIEQDALAAAFIRALERTIQTAATAPHQDVPIRGETWEADSELGVIIPGGVTGSDADLAAVAVAAATGATHESGGPTTDVVIASFTVPNGSYAVVDDVRIRADSEIGFRLVQFTLQIGGSRARSLNQRVSAFDRDTPTRVRRIAAPGQLIRLLGTNTDTECAHFVEGVIRGWFFPVNALSESLRATIQF